MTQETKKYEKRPWGYYEVLCAGNAEEGMAYQVKRLVIFPGKQFSLQTHEHREEYWVIAQGQGTIRIGNTMYPKTVGDQMYVPKRILHRAKNTGLEDLVIIETQIGTYLGEDDIKRFEDDFGRVEKDEYVRRTK